MCFLTLAKKECELDQIDECVFFSWELDRLDMHLS